MLWPTAKVWAQTPVYVMNNQTVGDCKAFFEDSGGNPVTPGSYGNNENFTFVINIPVAQQIVMSFQNFCTEALFDVLRVYDGPDTNSTLIGTFSGNVTPPVLRAFSGAMTLHFRTDLSVVCTGWNASWYTIVPPPVPPVISQVGAQCLSSSIDLTLNGRVHCDSVYPGAFVLSGSPARTVVAAQALNCVGDSTSQLRLTLNSPFSDCAAYGLQWTLNMLDFCDSLYVFILNSSFVINDCPLAATLIASNDSICIGGCITLTAQPSGGDCQYSFSWNPPLPPTAGPHQVCPPLGTTTYSVSIQDVRGNGPVSATVTILVSPVPQAGVDTTVCLQSPAFNLAPRVTPAGGWFAGPGISQAQLGTFNPASAGVGVHNIFYDRLGCRDSMRITVVQVQSGRTLAACPSAPAFQLTGAVPPGGVWSGPRVTPGGIYTPADSARADTLYYNALGCSSMRIIMIDTVEISGPTTVCQNAPLFTLQFNPVGGVWSGMGVTDTLLGRFNPANMAVGVNWLVYRVNGCRDSLPVQITQIDAGPMRTYCPLNAPLLLPTGTPAGGVWSGPGILDTSTGLFNPNVNGNASSTTYAIYSLGGCSDSLSIRLIRTNLGPDTVARCLTDGVYALSAAALNRNPTGGVWSGPGVNPSGNGSFNPALVGVGFHRLYYTANGCTDSVVIRVDPRPVLQPDTAVCVLSNPFLLRSNVVGGTWSGPGIVNATTGLYHPTVAGIGVHRIIQALTGGCRDTLFVTVQAVSSPQFTLSPSTFCCRDTLWTLNASPAGGLFSGPGVVGNQFNPRVAGVGSHWLVYSVGAGLCLRRDSTQITVLSGLSINLSLPKDTFCVGEQVRIAAIGTGGLPAKTVVWFPGGIMSDTLVFAATASGWYRAVLSDGCSDVSTDSIFVYVHPPLLYQKVQTQVGCYDSVGTYEIRYPAGSPYRIRWLTQPSVNGPVLLRPQGSYAFSLTDTLTGCTTTDTVQMREHPFITARFSVNPNRSNCVELNEAEFTLIDLSVGASTCTWYPGDGSQIPYVAGQYPRFQYADTGRYVIRLYVENNAGCSAEMEQTVCVKITPRILAPDAFTPNANGNNDSFLVVSFGITEMETRIYDRWGHQVYFSEQLNFRWDGTENGNPLPAGVYPYLIRYRDYSGRSNRIYRGTVQLIR
ncbi:MAG: gliding motility-associated C-terminal domain-containing protein [Bacteroidota bacterium]